MSLQNRRQPMLLINLFYGIVMMLEVCSGCREECRKEMSPVCGSDGRIYASVCHMKPKCGEENNEIADVSLVPDKYCMRAEGSTCAHRCTDEHDPVCGTNGRTYQNLCFLRVDTCRYGISFSHFGQCIAGVSNSSCPETCAGYPEDAPVCASNGNVYSSTCDMLQQTCGQKVVQTNYKHCQTTKSCNDVCFYDYKPVCGSDGRIYQSLCQMKVTNCGKHIFEMPMVHCRPQERTTAACPIACGREKADAVCGSDGNIYDSECDMQRLNCGSANAFNIMSLHLNRCDKRLKRCNKIKCFTSYDPVCGTDGYTYQNYCLLHMANCKKGVKLAHYGKCSEVDFEDCNSLCADSEKESDAPICGSDGNVYESICEMKRKTCGQRVVPAALHHCQMTQHCLSDCKARGADASMVCGSDNKVYRNACHMKADNCGQHVYEVPLSECVRGFRFLRCLRLCPAVFDPVCGTDGKTYTNECFLKIEECRSRSLGRSRVTRTYHGRCGQPQPQAKQLYLF